MFWRNLHQTFKWVGLINMQQINKNCCCCCLKWLGVLWLKFYRIKVCHLVEVWETTTVFPVLASLFKLVVLFLYRIASRSYMQHSLDNISLTWHRNKYVTWTRKNTTDLYILNPIYPLFICISFGVIHTITPNIKDKHGE